MEKYTLDIVTSAFNEEECVMELFQRIDKVMAAHPNYDWRLIFCDNHSTDQTWNIIERIAEESGRVLGVRMSRTFSLDAAFTMGIDIATADALVIMTSDLQDPPENISDFLREFELGSDQVVARVIRRQHVPILRRSLSSVFYWLANRATNDMIPRGVSDFRLLSRRAYLGARQMQERHRFLRGLLAWTGFKTTVIEIERPKRYAGESKFMGAKITTVVRLAISAILSHTSGPLIFLSVFGFILSSISFLITFVASAYWFVSGVPFAGFGTIVGVVMLGFSLTMLAIGVIAQYIALIYDEVKARPHYIISERTDSEM
jgi:glycosyltransferase involved in cell wall biosynthesis